MRSRPCRLSTGGGGAEPLLGLPPRSRRSKMEPGDETLMLEHPINFVGNETDDLHCFQACIRMACQGLSGESLSLEDADRMTGFEPGRQTWPFVGMLSLAEARYDVRSIEDFNPKHFITDPEAEIRRHAGDAELGQH